MRKNSTDIQMTNTNIPKTAFSLQDHQFMQRAITLAKKGHFSTSPNPRVGCVLVKNNQIIGEGYHVRAGTGHAEVNALAMAGNNAVGATAYVTLEPCSHFGRTPPCAKALIDAKVSRVVAAMVDPNPQVSGRGLALLAEAGIVTEHGLLNADARALNTGFITLMETGLPYVRVKLASSLDGKTAMANGESQWITSSQARKDVQRLRAQSCAVISGADAVIFDNARMTVRANELTNIKQKYPEKYFNTYEIRQPTRVIIDSQNRLSPQLALFQQTGRIIIIRTELENIHQWPHFVEQLVIPKVKENNKVDLRALLKALGKQGINDVLVESGEKLAGAFIAQNLVDQLILFQAPKLMGAKAKSLVDLPNIEHLAQAKNLNITDVRMIGADIRIMATFIKEKS